MNKPPEKSGDGKQVVSAAGEESVEIKIYLPVRLGNVLNQIKFLWGISKSEVVRMALEDFLRSARPPGDR